MTTKAALPPSQGNPITVRLGIANRVGMIGKVTSAIGNAGGNIGAIDLVQVREGRVIRDITFDTRDDAQAQEVLAALRRLKGVRLINYSDRILASHLGGKLEISSRIPLKTRQDLSIAYTPGVGQVSMHIHNNPQAVWNLTIKRNAVAVVSDGTAVLGLGDIGPQAAMPVMEGKAILFKEFGGVNAWPICLDTKDPDEIIEATRHIAPGFGGINLEDISAPRCFYIEDELKKKLDIPVFHDDQHGTSVVVLAALLNSLKLVKKSPEKLRVVILGMGAAGVACTKIFLNQGIKNIVGCDRSGIIYRGRRENMNEVKEWIAQNTNPDNLKGSIHDAMQEADLFVGVSGPGLITVADVKRMARDPIVFAMANPVPEIMPSEVAHYARIMATGRSDFANQINNVLCFPGMFRGALDVQASAINEEMKLAAAHALASIVKPRELREDYIIPSVFNRSVAPAIARAVGKAARATGVARRRRAPG